MTLALAGGNIANILVVRFDSTTRQWNRVPCVAGGSGLVCTTSAFSVWAVMVKPVAGVTLQQATPAAPRPATTGTGVGDDSTMLLPMLALILAAGGLVGVGAYAVQRWRS